MPTVLFLLLGLGCRVGTPTVATHPRHVIVLSIDTVRADVWPGTDLLPDAVHFQRAVAAAPTTLASHTSLMTGMYPHRHGVPRNEFEVDGRNTLLAERLDAVGFKTAAFLGAMPLGAHTRFTQGFDHVDERFDRPRQAGLFEQTERAGEQVTQAATEWLADQDPQTDRLFVFVHWFDAHQPYLSMPGQPASIANIEVVRTAIEQGQGHRASEHLETLYAADVAVVGRQVAALLAWLRANDLYNDTLIVVAGDHGEAYASHEEVWDHGWRVYNETVWVPFAMQGPGLLPFRTNTTVSLVDVTPTILGVLNLPADGLDGVDLQPLLQGRDLDRGPVFTEATKPYAPPEEGWANRDRWKAVMHDGYKLHFDPVSGEQLLYRRGDREESLPLDPELNATRVAALRAALDRWTASADPLPSQKVSDAEAIERLRSLGYLE